MFSAVQYHHPNAWLIQQQQFYSFQHYNHQHQQPRSPLDSLNLKHKEVLLYKTESCRNWAELGHCRYGKKCRYAHGDSELRTVPRHTRYKTQICRAYHMDGSCPYGIRCTFVHDATDNDISSISSNSSGSSNANNDTNLILEAPTLQSYNPHKQYFIMKQQQQPKQSIETMHYNHRTMWM
ncbi:hypothetical protein [Parasitella parasitica]|uniref:C3H1-type domain-containing protein n=1 Tax=Parasitella parasitica TaxID=35722 RepID=A0A0B7MWS0_9FUNG|nr:hypothetical protein [Parasitella parasitica]